MDECKEGIRYAFQTKNPFTITLSCTGHAGMEAVMVNILERGDTVLIAENGIWGQRAADMAGRQGEDLKSETSLYLITITLYPKVPM
jgi:alanine-glyoxylate transaminase/serine-glyoxylate transaminase/serine-pyruvate transaminase